MTTALGLLESGGLLVRPGGSDPCPTSLATRQLRLVGAGSVGLQVATLLVRSGVGVLYVVDDEPPERTLYPRAGALSSRAEALRACLDGTAATQVYAVDHWTKPDDRSVDLTILACDGPEVDRVILDHLVRSDQPHLLVRSWGTASASVRSCCLAKPRVCSAAT